MRKKYSNQTLDVLRAAADANGYKFNAAKAHEELSKEASDFLARMSSGAKRKQPHSRGTLFKAFCNLEAEYKRVWSMIEDDLFIELNLSHPSDCDDVWKEVQESLSWHRRLIEPKKKDAKRNRVAVIQLIISALLDIFHEHTGPNATTQRPNGGGKPSAQAIEFVNAAIEDYGLAPLIKKPGKKALAFNASARRNIDESIVKAIYARRPGRLMRLAAKNNCIVV